MRLPSLHRLRIYIALGIFLVISLIIVLANRGSLPAFVYSLYTFPFGDKVGHFLLMGSLALGLNLLFHKQPSQISARTLFTGSKIALIGVTLEEISQLVFTTRSFSIIDLCFSYLGIIFVEVLLRAWKYRRGRVKITRVNLPGSLSSDREPPSTAKRVL